MAAANRPSRKKTLSGKKSAWMTPCGRAAGQPAARAVEVAGDLVPRRPGLKLRGGLAAGLEHRRPVRLAEVVLAVSGEALGRQMQPGQRLAGLAAVGGLRPLAADTPGRKETSAAGLPRQRASGNGPGGRTGAGGPDSRGRPASASGRGSRAGPLRASAARKSVRMKRGRSVSSRKLELETPSAIPLKETSRPRSNSARKASSSASVMSV